MPLHVAVDYGAADVCRRRHTRRRALVGAVLRNARTPHRDRDGPSGRTRMAGTVSYVGLSLGR